MPDPSGPDGLLGFHKVWRRSVPLAPPAPLTPSADFAIAFPLQNFWGLNEHFHSRQSSINVYIL
jgi:hypothetical protein